MSETVSAIPVVDAEHPWLGLLSFTEKTRKFFFGRDAEIAEIIDRIRENTLTVLFGQSGLGKTSLLGAGVLPHLQETGHSPVLLRLDHDPAGPSLLQQTRAALFSAIPGASLPDDHAEITLWELFHRKPLLLPDDAPPPVILFDQFEEIFTLGDEEQAADWIEQVADLLQNRPPQSLESRFEENRRLARDYDFLRTPIRFVFSLREDYLHHLERWKTRLPLLVQNRMSLQLLNGQRALDAVIGPASLRATPLVSAEVASTIVRTVADVAPDTPLQQIKAVPPLLSLLCEQLNLARIAAGAETIEAEMVAEESSDILQRFYDDSFSVFPENQRECIRRIVEDPPMVTEGGHRNSMVREDAEASLRASGVPEPHKVFDTLIHRRLLTAEEHAGLQRLEITHDVLVPLVVHSRKQRRDRQIENEKLAAEALALSEARKRARLRILLAGSLVLLALSIIAGFYAFGQKTLAEHSERKAKEASRTAIASEEKATAALTDARRSEQTAKDALVRQRQEEEKQQTLLRQASMADHQAGVRASDAGNSSEALAHFERALRYWPENANVAERALSELHSVDNGSNRHLFTSSFSSGVARTAYSPDGSLLAAATSGGEIRVVDARSGNLIWKTVITNTPRALVFSKDGTKLAYGGNDQILNVADARTGKILLTHTFKDYLLTIDFSPDSTQVAAGSGDSWIKVFRLADSGIVWDRTAGEPVLAIRFSPDGKHLAVGTSKGGLHMLESDTALRTWNVNLEDDIKAISFHPNGRRIAVGCKNNTLHALDSSDGGGRWKKNFRGSVNHAAFSPDGNLLAAGSDDNTFYVTNIVSGSEWRYICNNPIWGFDFSPDGNFIAVASSDAHLRILDPYGEKVVWEEKFPHFVQTCSFSPDGIHIAAGSGDKTLRVFRLAMKPPSLFVPFANTVSHAFFHPDGSKITAASYDYSLRTVDSRDGTETWRDYSGDSVTHLARSKDSSLIISAADDKTLRAFRPDGTALWNITLPAPASSLSVNSDASLIAVGLTDQTIAILDSSGTILWTKKLDNGTVRQIVCTPSGDRILTGTQYGPIFCFDRSGNEQWKTDGDGGGQVNVISLSPAADTIAIADRSNEFRVLRVSDGSLVWKAHSPGVIYSTCYSPDGKYVALGGSDNILHLLAAADGSSVWSLAFSRAASDFAFSPDGTRLAAAIEDKTLRVFDIRDGGELWSTSFEKETSSVAFSPDGRRILGTSLDSTLRICDFPSIPNGKEEIDLLRALLITRGNACFDQVGRIRPPTENEAKDHLAKLEAARQNPPSGSFRQFLLWESTPAAVNTTSPGSEVPQYRAAGRSLQAATTVSAARIGSLFFPWHPLSPLAVAHLESSASMITDRYPHLSRLVSERMATAAASSGWDKADLSGCYATAANWMKDVNAGATSLKTAREGIAIAPSNLDLLRILVFYGNETERLECGEKVIADPASTSYDWSNTSYNYAKAVTSDPKYLPRARELIAESLRRFPNDHTASYYVGWALLNLDDLKEANKQFKEAFRIMEAKKLVPVRDQLIGITLSTWQSGEKDLSLTYARKLAELEPALFKPNGPDMFSWPEKEMHYLRIAIPGLLKLEPSLAKAGDKAKS